MVLSQKIINFVPACIHGHFFLVQEKNATENDRIKWYTTQVFE